MTTISWKQIDTNHNGFVDGNEATVAKQKGVKNIWDYMTENDYKKNITREQKLNNCYNKSNKESVYENQIVNNINIFIGNHEKSDFKYAKFITENEVLELGIKLESKQNQIKDLKAKLQKQEENIRNEYSTTKEFINDALTFFNCDIDYFKPSKKVVKAKKEYEKTLSQIKTLESEAWEIKHKIHDLKSNVEYQKDGIEHANLNTPIKERIEVCQSEINNIKLKMKNYKNKSEDDLPHKEYDRLQYLKFDLEDKTKDLEHLKEIQKWENEQK